MTDFKFMSIDYDPRSVKRRGRKGDPRIIEFAAALRANPHRWAEYPYELTPNTGWVTASRINNGGPAPIPLRGGDFQAHCKNGALYVRYNPQEPA